MIAGALLEKPLLLNGRVHKGAIILSPPDEVCRMVPELKDFFYIIERRGWEGMNDSATADIKLVEDRSTWRITQAAFPKAILLDLAGADFVNTDVFRPLAMEKTYAGIQISCWQLFKRHELFVHGASLSPDRRFLKFGHFVNGGDPEELALKKYILLLSRKLGAQITFPFASLTSNKGLPCRAEEVNKYINRAIMGILTTAVEGVNRFKTECMAADIPVLVPSDTRTPTKKHINGQTGLFFEPTPQGLAEAVSLVLKNRSRFSPRRYILMHSGQQRSLAQLVNALNGLATKDGCVPHYDNIDWDGRNQSLLWGTPVIDVIRLTIAEMQA